MTATDDVPAEHQHRVSERIGAGSVSVTRTGARSFEGLNERGSTVRIGTTEADGHFTPGELMKLALIACAGMSSDRVVARRLGDDFALTIWGHGKSDHADNRYHRIEEELLVDLSVLAPDERSKLIGIMVKAIDHGCTVARTLEGGVELGMTIDGETV